MTLGDARTDVRTAVAAAALHVIVRDHASVTREPASPARTCPQA
jgi:hypothetical protein